MDDDDVDPRCLALGQRIRRWRKRRGLSQKEFAAITEIPENTLRSWEYGRRGMRAVELPRIAAALQVDPAVLLGMKSEQFELDAERTGSVYFVMRDALRRIERAKSIKELRDIYFYGIRSGFEIPADAEEVTTEEWGRIEAAVDAKIAALGGIPRSW